MVRLGTWTIPAQALSERIVASSNEERADGKGGCTHAIASERRLIMLLTRAYVQGLIKSMREGSGGALDKLYRIASMRIEEGRSRQNMLVWMAREAVEGSSGC